MKQVEQFYDNKDEPNKSCLLALRSVILQYNSHIDETVKYGMPCFTLGKRPFCYLWVDKKTHEPYILMIQGKLLSHPQLEQGDRKQGKIFRVNPNDDLPIATIHEIFEEAIKHYSI